MNITLLHRTLALNMNHCCASVQYEGNSEDTGLQDPRKSLYRPKSNQEADYTQAWHSIHHLSLINTVTFHKVPIPHPFHCMPIHTAPFNTYLHTHTPPFFRGSQMAWVFSMPGKVDFIPTTIVCVREGRPFHMCLPGPVSSSALNSLSPLSPAGCSSQGV